MLLYSKRRFVPRLGLLSEYEQRIAVRAEIVMFVLQCKACRFDGIDEFAEAVHFARAVCHARKVKRCRLQRIRARFKALFIPQRFEYVHIRFGLRRTVHFR